MLFLVVGAGLSSSLACDEIRVERRGAGASAESTAFLGGILMVRGLVSGGSMWSVRKSLPTAYRSCVPTIPHGFLVSDHIKAHGSSK